MAGWIKLHRSIVDSDIYQMPPLYLRVFERLIIEANHQDNEIPYKEKGSKVVGKKLIKRGERLTSVRDICRWVSWYERGKVKEPNPKTMQNILDWLEENCMIEIYGEKGNRKETHYKIVNYNIYQAKDDEEVTEKKQPSNSKTTVTGDKQECIKNVKNDKEVCMYDENLKTISKLHEENIGPIYSITAEQLIKVSEEYPGDLFKEALAIAINKKKRHLNYIVGILRNWKDNNILTVDDLEAFRREKETEKEEKQQKNKQYSQPAKNKKTRFHNFAQRTDKYSEDDLEAIARRKREEHLKKLEEKKEAL